MAENKMAKDEVFMAEAVRLSALAVEHGNEPFGAVLVKDGEIVFREENQVNTLHDPSYHAEAGLLRRFCAETGITDLQEYTLYASCEPCFMCAGAMVWVKLGRLVYGVSHWELCEMLDMEPRNSSQIVFENSHHKPEVTGGVLAEEGMKVLRKRFFYE